MGFSAVLLGLVGALALVSGWLVVSVLEVVAQGQSDASALLYDKAGHLMATATLRQGSNQVQIHLEFADRSLTGTHAIHIHEAGRCDPPEFSSAGGIFNPSRKQHGLLNPDGPMVGDLPSLVIGPSGVAGYNLSTPLVNLAGGPESLVRPGGTSLVVFERVDDDRTQPDGNAGARIACGAIVAGPPGSSAPGASTPADPQRNSFTTVLIGGFGLLSIGAGLMLRQRGVRRS